MSLAQVTGPKQVLRQSSQRIVGFSRPECQRRRRPDYHRRKLEADREYRQVVRDSQKRDLLRYNLQTVRAYLLKENFKQFWEYNLRALLSAIALDSNGGLVLRWISCY